MSDDNGKLLAESLAVSAVAVAAFTAALLGTVFGIAISRRRVIEGADPGEGGDGGGELISWTRLSRLEEELDQSRIKLEGLKRDYELDTGLLKQEIQRLELLLGRFSSSEIGSVDAASSSRVRPGYHSLRLVDPLSVPETTIKYSTLASLESGRSS